MLELLGSMLRKPTWSSSPGLPYLPHLVAPHEAGRLRVRWYTGGMDTRRLLFLQLFLIAIVAVLHLVGTALSLYWVFWWYDMVVHFLASIWVALAALSIASHLGFQRVGLWVFACVIAVSIGWEFFEYGIGATDAAERRVFVIDTALDFVVNMIGGLLGLYLGRGK